MVLLSVEKFSEGQDRAGKNISTVADASASYVFSINLSFRISIELQY